MMVCLRCGYCCHASAVVIVRDPAKGIEQENLGYKASGERCQHFRGHKPGEYSCAIHDEPWYRETPCSQHGQIEQSVHDVCRMGAYTLDASAEGG